MLLALDEHRPLAQLKRDDLTRLTLPALRDLAKSNSVHIPSKMAKALVIERLLKGDSIQVNTPVRRPHKGPRTPSSPLKRVTLSSLRALQLKTPGPLNDPISPGHPGGDKILPITWALSVKKLVATRDLSVNSSISFRDDGFRPESRSNLGSAPVRSHALASSSHEARLLGSLPEALLASPATALQGLPHQQISHDPYTIILAKGRVFEYSEADFQNIPSTSGVFSEPSRLAAVWDDNSPLWGQKDISPLIVRNCPIAIKYWQDFYKSFQGKEHQSSWNAWRQNWYNYKDLMEEYQTLGDAAFKEKWSTKLCSSRILSTVRDQRKSNWYQLAERARLEYPGEAFSICFGYQKKGQWVVPHQPKAIAKRYLMLKGVAT